MYRMDANKMRWEKAKWELHKNPVCYLEQILEVTPHKTAALTIYLSSHSSKMNMTWGTDGKARTNS